MPPLVLTTNLLHNDDLRGQSARMSKQGALRPPVTLRGCTAFRSSRSRKGLAEAGADVRRPAD